jgi:hypothetical protein
MFGYAYPTILIEYPPLKFSFEIDDHKIPQMSINEL